ncbi:hypothetical protein EDB89DRAFT_2072608 [Lactarius sanguifluus]|nr:hypothetical protein EDB89DRAFT_2072608 [Lactarius sanguifluus]
MQASTSQPTNSPSTTFPTPIRKRVDKTPDVQRTALMTLGTSQALKDAFGLPFHTGTAGDALPVSAPAAPCLRLHLPLRPPQPLHPRSLTATGTDMNRSMGVSVDALWGFELEPNPPLS